MFDDGPEAVNQHTINSMLIDSSNKPPFDDGSAFDLTA
jgi:hypothetical protein